MRGLSVGNLGNKFVDISDFFIKLCLFEAPVTPNVLSYHTVSKHVSLCTKIYVIYFCRSSARTHTLKVFEISTKN